MRTINLTATLLSASFISLGLSKVCPPLGRVLPAPHTPSENQAVKGAIETLKASLDGIFSSKLANSGVSIAVKSIHEDSLLFNHHFTPSNMSGIGTNMIDEHTIYRVGSISKMMPALAALQNSKINMDDSVLDYLPDLKSRFDAHESIYSIPWEDITVSSLASHLSGIATDMAFDLAIFPKAPWTDMGLPEVVNGTGPSCSGLPGTKPCTADDIIDTINRRSSVYLPYTSPVYSNVGYAVLGMIVEAVTGKTFEDVAESDIFDVAGMNSTSFNGPIQSFSERMFVPMGESTWKATLGVFEAAGGMFSNTVDMVAFCEAILKNKFLSPRKTREWMRPMTHTSSFGTSVGAPWEILRSSNLTKDKRLIDVYTKSGDLGLYHAIVGAVPDYDIVITILTGGIEVTLESQARSEIFSAVVQTFLPAIDSAARYESTANGYVGTFADNTTNSTLKLSIDEGPGVVIESFVVRGFDVLGNIPKYSIGSAGTGVLGLNDAFIEGRLYPTDIASKPGKCSLKTAWRAVFETLAEKEKSALNSKLFYVDGSCDSWFGIDRFAYNYSSLAEFVVTTDKFGRVKEVRNAAFDVTLTRI